MKRGRGIITIFGTSRAGPADEVYKTAYELGAGLGRKGFVIANGGYGGTMLAAAEGADSVGAKVIGVTCLAFGRTGANEFVTEEIVTASLTERLGRLVDLGDAYIVLRGSTGTLLELAEVWELKNKGLIGSTKPVVLVGSFWRGLVDLIGGADSGSVDCLEIVDSVQEAIDIVAGQIE